MNKREAREIFRDIRSGLSGSITRNIFSWDLYKRCESILCFVSFGSEIDTREVIKKSIAKGKKVAVPFIKNKKGDMVFIEISSLKELEKNEIGILEPKYEESKIFVPNKRSIIIVPGLIYDTDFYRIGYGGGYYDRYLASNEFLCSVGVCFEKQIVNTLPRDDYDMSVDYIATEDRIIRRF